MGDAVAVPGHVRVRNRSLADVEQALSLLDAARRVQAARVRGHAEQLLAAMADVGMDLTPPAGMRQAERLAAHKSQLLSKGAWTYQALADTTGRRNGSIRTWASRARDAKSLFIVKDGQRTLIPAVQLQPDGTPRAEVTALVTILRAAGLDGWELWSWLCSPTGRLSGAVPEEVARTQPDRALGAARRYARELESARDG